MPMKYEDYSDPYEARKAGVQPSSPAGLFGGNTGTGSDASVAEANTAYAGGQRGADPNKVAGYSDPGAFKQWYGQQQGGNRPEDLARFTEAGGDFNKQGQGMQVLAGWDNYLQKEGPNAGKYRSMRGAEGYFDKPTECPEGMVPGGGKESDPCIWPGGQGGGGQGGGGGGDQGGGGQGGGGGYGGGGGQNQWDNPIYKYLSGSALQSAQDPEAALRNYMGQGGAAQWSGQVDQAREAVNRMPPGPARDAAASRLEEQKLTSMGGMRQAAAGAARNELGGLLGQEYNWQGQLPLSYAQLAEQGRSNQANEGIGMYGAQTGRMTGMGNLGLGYAELGQRGSEFGQTMGYNREGMQNANQQALLDRQQQTRENKASRPSGLDKALGFVGGILSDIRVKENILEEQPALSRLAALPVYSYNYSFEPKSKRRLGLMAQDVEKVAPELVEEGEDGLKRVDAYGLLALTIGAVKELGDAGTN